MANKFRLKKGLVHIYTGEGKGKTTAAFGLAMRAAGQGLTVSIYQFLKKSRYLTGEFKAARKTKGIKIVCFNQGVPLGCRNFKRKKRDRLKNRVKIDLEIVKRDLKANKPDLVILDEILVAVQKKLISEREILAFFRQKLPTVELVLTGRGATKKLIRAADYVSEVSKKKHPYDKGIVARRGIEY